MGDPEWVRSDSLYSQETFAKAKSLLSKKNLYIIYVYIYVYIRIVYNVMQ